MKRILSFIAIFALLAIFATTVTDARIKQCPGREIISCCMDQSHNAYYDSYDNCDRSRYSDFQCKANADDAWMDMNRNCMSPFYYHTFASATSPTARIVIRNAEQKATTAMMRLQQRGDFQGEVRLNGTLVGTAAPGSIGSETTIVLQPGDNVFEITITPETANDLLALYLSKTTEK